MNTLHITYLVTCPKTFIMPNGIFTAISHVILEIDGSTPGTAVVLCDDTRLALAGTAENDDRKSLVSTVITVQ